MKHTKYILTVTTLIILQLGFIACSSNRKIVAYECPMHCQADTVYSNAGTCPVCKMELTGIEQFDASKTTIINNN